MDGIIAESFFSETYFAAGSAVRVMTRPKSLAFSCIVDLLFLIALPAELHAFVDIVLTVLPHSIDQARQSVGARKMGAQPSEFRSQGSLAAPQTRDRHAEGSGRPIPHVAGSVMVRLTSGDSVAGTPPEPEGRSHVSRSYALHRAQRHPLRHGFSCRRCLSQFP